MAQNYCPDAGRSLILSGGSCAAMIPARSVAIAAVGHERQLSHPAMRSSGKRFTRITKNNVTFVTKDTKRPVFCPVAGLVWMVAGPTGRRTAAGAYYYWQGSSIVTGGCRCTRFSPRDKQDYIDMWPRRISPTPSEV